MGTIVTPSDEGRIDADSVRLVTQKAGGGVKSAVAWLWCEFHRTRCPSQSCALCSTLPEGSPRTHAIRQTPHQAGIDEQEEDREASIPSYRKLWHYLNNRWCQLSQPTTHRHHHLDPTSPLTRLHHYQYHHQTHHLLRKPPPFLRQVFLLAVLLSEAHFRLLSQASTASGRRPGTGWLVSGARTTPAQRSHRSRRSTPSCIGRACAVIVVMAPNRPRGEIGMSPRSRPPANNKKSDTARGGPK